MRLLAALLLALTAAACGDSPCQELGERICRCQPGLGQDACKTQVEEQLKDVDPGDGFCEDRLATCNHPTGGDLCEYLLTEAGKIACGLASEPPAP